MSLTEGLPGGRVGGKRKAVEGVGVIDPLLGGLCRKIAVAGVGGVGERGGEEATDAPREANVGLSLR